MKHTFYLLICFNTTSVFIGLTAMKEGLHKLSQAGFKPGSTAWEPMVKESLYPDNNSSIKCFEGEKKTKIQSMRSGQDSIPSLHFVEIK